MSSEKYKVEIDPILKDIFKNASKSITQKNRIEFSDSLIDNGEFKKIAYDMYRSVNDRYANLWSLEEIDGKKFLIRSEDPQFEVTASGDWEVAASYNKDFLTLSYKNIPITRFSSDEYGFNKDDVSMFKMAVIERITNDQEFIKELLMEQGEAKRESLASIFPEFGKIIKG